MKDKLIILTGPTGIGKTELSLSIAKKYNAEIISCDSMQIYKYMDIGTAKINLEKTDVVHHMVDIIMPDSDYSVAEYAKEVKNLIRDINSRGKIPIMVGGTGLYVNSIVYNLNFSNVEPHPDFREKMEKIAEEKGKEYLYNILFEKDKEAAKKIDMNNKKRVIRALEINEFSGGKEVKEFRTENEDYDLLMIGLNMDRTRLYERINKRVDIMFEKGLLDEVKSILDKGYTKDLYSMKAIGYKEVIEYLDGEISYDKMVDDIKKNSRHYAKRQLTWFRRDKRIKWFDREDKNLEEEVVRYIGDYCGNI